MTYDRARLAGLFADLERVLEAMGLAPAALDAATADQVRAGIRADLAAVLGRTDLSEDIIAAVIAGLGLATVFHWANWPMTAAHAAGLVRWQQQLLALLDDPSPVDMAALEAALTLPAPDPPRPRRWFRGDR